MTREPLLRVQSPYLVLPQADIDTDQIIPARFLTTTEREGLGVHAFADWRAAGATPLDDPRAAGCRVLCAGDNFGCGSSREHAPWALLDFGFRAVVSTSFADIFRQNALKNGLLTVVVDADTHRALCARPFAEVDIDVVAQTLTPAGGAPVGFELDAFAKTCLTEGIDELAYILGHEDAIRAFEARAAGG